MERAPVTDAGGLRARILARRGSFTLELELDIEPGTTVALLGPNGAGKSTTIDVLAGIAPLDEGRIELDGRVLDDTRQAVHVATEDRRMGVVFQRYLLFDHLSVLDNVAFGPAAAGRRRRVARARAAELLAELGLDELAHRWPRELSGGQAQLVALARALATDPAALLLDEPLAALDVATRSRLRRDLGDRLAAYPGPRVLITHDPTDAFLLADRVDILEDGRITQRGAPDEIRRRPATPYVAALAGVNLFSGVNRGGTVALDDHPQALRTADAHTLGAVLVTIRPNAISLHAEEPHGSPRNTWRTTVAALEPLGEITRVMLEAPLPLSVDVTPGAAGALGLVPGHAVWVSIKATEIAVSPVEAPT